MNKNKRTLFIALVLTFITYTNPAKSIEGIRLSVKTNNSFKQSIENKNKLDEIKTDSDSLEDNIKKQKSCSDKELIYLGSGASDVDSDNCFDITNATNSSSTSTDIRPTIAGVLSNMVAFCEPSSFYNASFKNRFSADKKCHTAFAGSRALTYEDLKYILKDMPNATYAGKSYWVFDSLKSEHLLKSDVYDPSINNNNGWHPLDTQDAAMSISVAPASPYVYTFNKSTCDKGRYILCVYQ